MDIGINEITNIIVASTTSYVEVFSPVFLLIGGLLLAIVVVFYLLGFFTGKKAELPQFEEFDDELADELEDFYSKRGRTTGDYDYTDIRG